MNVCGKFHWNPFTKIDIASREIGVNGRTDGQPDGQQENIMPLPLIVGGETYELQWLAVVVFFYFDDKRVKDGEVILKGQHKQVRQP